MGVEQTLPVPAVLGPYHSVPSGTPFLNLGRWNTTPTALCFWSDHWGPNQTNGTLLFMFNLTLYPCFLLNPSIYLTFHWAFKASHLLLPSLLIFNS